MVRQRLNSFADAGATGCSFYDLELAAAEGPELVYTRAQVDSYIEPTELAALAADGPNDHLAPRIVDIR